MCTLLPFFMPFTRLMVKVVKQSLAWNLVECLGEIQDGHVHFHHYPFARLRWSLYSLLKETLSNAFEKSRIVIFIVPPLFMPFFEVDDKVFAVSSVEPCQMLWWNPGWSCASSPLSMPVARLRWSLLSSLLYGTVSNPFEKSRMVMFFVPPLFMPVCEVDGKVY